MPYDQICKLDFCTERMHACKVFDARVTNRMLILHLNRFEVRWKVHKMQTNIVQIPRIKMFPFLVFGKTHSKSIRSDVFLLSLKTILL